MNEITKRRGGLTAIMAAKFDMDPGMFLSVIKNTVMPSKATNEEVAAFLMVAKEYNLNPLMKEIYAFPKKGEGEGIQPIVGVDGWAKIICGNDDFDGVDFEYQDDDKGNPVSVTCSLYRKSCSRPTRVTEYYEECKRNTEPWRNMPRRMLRHKALMQCGRIAFGLSGITDEDEANDIREAHAEVIPDPLTIGTSKMRAKPEATKPKAKRGRPKKEKEEEQKVEPIQSVEATVEPEQDIDHELQEAYDNMREKYLEDGFDDMIDAALESQGLPALSDIQVAELGERKGQFLAAYSEVSSNF